MTEPAKKKSPPKVDEYGRRRLDWQFISLPDDEALADDLDLSVLRDSRLLLWQIRGLLRILVGLSIAGALGALVLFIYLVTNAPRY